MTVVIAEWSWVKSARASSPLLIAKVVGFAGAGMLVVAVAIKDYGSEAGVNMKSFMKGGGVSSPQFPSPTLAKS